MDKVTSGVGCMSIGLIVQSFLLSDFGLAFIHNWHVIV
jgi:hypothetical protein